MYILLNCLTCCRSGFNWKCRLRDEFRFVFTIFVKAKLAVSDSMAGSNSDDVARYLNALTLMNMQDIAGEDIFSELVSVYFGTHPIGNSDDDTDVSGSSGDDCDTEADNNVSSELTTYSWKSATS